jgi:hypothetical protein
MVEQFFGRWGQGHSGALIHHRKSLIGKDFVDWTRDTAGVADCGGRRRILSNQIVRSLTDRGDPGEEVTHVNGAPVRKTLTPSIQLVNREESLREQCLRTRRLDVKSVTGGLSELSKIAFGLEFVVVNSGFKLKRN